MSGSDWTGFSGGVLRPGMTRCTEAKGQRKARDWWEARDYQAQ